MRFAPGVVAWLGLLSAVPIPAVHGATGCTPAEGAVPILDRGALRAAYEEARHRVVAEAGGHVARNPGQRWTTRFDGRGATTMPDGEGWSWGLELARFGFDGHERVIEGRAEVRVEGQRVTYDWGAGLEEWYVNDGRGLEHGFTVREGPAGESNPETTLAFTLALRGDLDRRVEASGRGVAFIDADGGRRLDYAGLVAFDADGRDLDARLEPAAIGLRLLVDARGARYPLTIDPVAQQAYLKASNTGSGDLFGESVSISGDTAVVGAVFEDSNATTVDGDGANNSATNAGAAYVFVFDGGTWSQQAYLKASNAQANDRFGISVAVSGDTIVVGAHWEDSAATGVNGDQANNSASASGAAYVFVRNGTSWSQQAYLKASNTQAFDTFGEAVAISGDTVVVGAKDEDSSATGVEGDGSNNDSTTSGAAYVFHRSGTSWSQQAYLKASNTGGADQFARSVAIDGDTVVVGAWREDSNATGVNGDGTNNSATESGAAYVYRRGGSTWSFDAYLKASNTGSGDRFGTSVGVSGGTIVVGASGESSAATGVGGDQSNNGAPSAGAAYVFVSSGGSWTQQAYVKASNTNPVDEFGWSVAVSGDVAVVTAPGEESNATGVDGNQSSNVMGSAGAAYLFTRSGTTWAQLAYLKASNTGLADQFGWSVSASGQRVLVGAHGEDSDATGVDGPQGNNSAPDSGAAYVFDLGPASPVTSFCFGDGTLATACPCGNPGQPGRGCENSIATGGAELTASGTTSPDTIVFQSGGELPTVLTIFLQGNATVASGAVFGDGVRCVAGSLKRLYTTNAIAGTATAPGAGDPPVTTQSSNLGDPIAPGSTRWYQAYYRDPDLAFCPGPAGGSFNASSGLAIVW